MERVKLIDVLGTKYIADHYSSELTTYLQSIDKDSIEIDLNDARLCTSTMEIVNAYLANGYKFVDTLDKSRGALLDESYLRRQNTYEAIPLPKMDGKKAQTVAGWVEYLKDLDSNAYYYIEDTPAEVAVAVTILLLRPKYKIDIDKAVNSFFNCVFGIIPSSFAMKVVKLGYPLIYPLKSTYAEVQPFLGEDGKYYATYPGDGTFDVETFRTTYKAVPNIFGTNATHRESVEDWKNIQQRMIEEAKLKCYTPDSTLVSFLGG